MPELKPVALEEIIQDANINFLLGSGLSSGFLGLLGSIEKLLTDLDAAAESGDAKKIVRASLYKKYFVDSVSGNTNILANDPKALPVLEQYKYFLLKLNSILIDRKNTLVGRQINLFTTNIDIFLERALGDTGLEFNDGFNGRFNPTFRLSNFKKTFMKKSAQYDNTFELPVFNVLKLHGSTTWTTDKEDHIVFLSGLETLAEIKKVLPADDKLVTVSETAEIAQLLEAAKAKGKPDSSLVKFMNEYEKLMVINPTKEKFKQTLLNQTYYELLRIYSNELEKENSVLFVLGFSFADEHIREITFRVAESNPTLVIYVLAFNSNARKQLEATLNVGGLKNSNIKIVAPPQKTEEGKDEPVDVYEYNFENINSIWLESILTVIRKDKGDGGQAK